MPTEVENDPLFQLLTDALRAGPASPPWREAVAKLRASGASAAGSDEYRLLIEARENLEVGKGYRAVRAGPVFTRKVLSGVDATSQARGGRKVPIAGIVAILAALVLIGVVAYVSHIIIGGQSNAGAVDELAATYFPTKYFSTNFNGPPTGELHAIGVMDMIGDKGLRIDSGEFSAIGRLGGGSTFAKAIPGDEPFVSQATVRPGPGSDQLAEVFVSSSPQFSQDRATAPHELVWLNRGPSQQVVVNGKVVVDKPMVRTANQSTLDVRILMNRDVAIVEVDHKRIWAGRHGLGDGPRYLGVRILTTGPGVVGKSAEPAIVDWKILK